MKRQFSRNLRTLDPRGKRTERTFVLIYPWYNTAHARWLPARRRGRICAHMSTLAPGQGAAPASPPARARHPRLRPLTSPPAASALRRSIHEDRLWSCEICARRHTREGVKGGRRSCAVAVTRGWVVCAAKQGQQQHRELQRTMQHTWSPTQRYSSSRVSPVARQDCEGVRCSRAERFFVRAHRIAPFARGRPSLEKRERVVERPWAANRLSTQLN